MDEQLRIGEEGAVIVGGLFSGYLLSPSTPISECLKECTTDERKAIEAHAPPYDGVRTWGDLEAVRAQPKRQLKDA